MALRPVPLTPLQCALELTASRGHRLLIHSWNCLKKLPSLQGERTLSSKEKENSSSEKSLTPPSSLWELNLVLLNLPELHLITFIC